jgi:transcription-repair coupling factor (superfamily II helicase)
VALPSLAGGSCAFAALAVAETRKTPVLAVVPGIPDADRLVDDLKTVSAGFSTRILEFPPMIPGDKTALGARLKTTAALRAWSIDPYPLVIVSAFPALAAPIPADGTAAITLSVASAADGTGVGISALVEKLAAAGYRRLPAVEAEGDFSVRGGIVDVWSPGDEFPVRAEFFGDGLESLRTFNPASQLSIDKIPSADFLPASEESAAASEPVPLTGLLPPGSSILAVEHNAYDLAGVTGARAFPVYYTGEPAPGKALPLPLPAAPLPGFAELGADEARHPELFDSARRRLERHLAAAAERGDAVIGIDDLSGGFELDGVVVVTKSDRVFAKRKARWRKSSVQVGGRRLEDFDGLEPGEYVVHVDHGVGRFIGSSEITVDGRRSEVFTVEYADGGKLHVPASHAHLLSRYVGVKGEEVRLHSLDGKRWAKDRKDAQKSVSDLAAALLETQARRETAPGFAYDTAVDGLEAFECAFPYEETPDQAAAIAAVKHDLASPRPMDRLICGDAGYGKTEVAMRAAFIAAMNGKQVAVLAPTTVLAEQHFETFTSRFDNTPVRIESVSRFQTSATHQGTFRRLETGVCDIVIGTHAILSPKIRFRDLGLVVIDEEQRFGVRHKEFLKSLRATADVLTLSATPIPRTLYLSMTGARDLSLLRTPPRERVAVETKIVRDEDAVVAGAVEAEIARGGQVYFLHNRVGTIGTAEKRLKALCPSARIVTAHGQMDSKTLARKMRLFENGEYDILLSTTIIESGIDIPRANTILIDRADTFGMADLYQLRGRVGRSSRQGYAYFLLPRSGILEADARERLAALKRHGGLGAGFNLAVRDLELRGAGNLLGRQQSGHIAAVGFTLYCQLLRRSIALLKGEKPRETVEVKLNFDFIDLSPASGDCGAAAALPYGYVEEDAQRIDFMKRLAETADRREVKKIEEELADRFGKLPPAAARLVKLAYLRVAASGADIGHIDVKGTRAVFYRPGGREIALVKTLAGRSADMKLKEISAALRTV